MSPDRALGFLEGLGRFNSGALLSYSRDQTGLKCAGAGRGSPWPFPRLGEILRHPSKQQIPMEKALSDGEGAAAVVTASWACHGCLSPAAPQADPLTSNTASAKTAQLGSPTKASKKPHSLGAALYHCLPPKRGLVKANARPIKSKGPHSQHRNAGP